LSFKRDLRKIEQIFFQKKKYLKIHWNLTVVTRYEPSWWRTRFGFFTFGEICIEKSVIFAKKCKNQQF
jgi:hypothetical protein